MTIDFDAVGTRSADARALHHLFAAGRLDKDGDVGEPIGYHFREDSTAARFAIQMRDIRHPVATVEVESPSGEYVTLRREGSWHVGEGLGEGPFNTRVTSIFDHVVEDLVIPLRPGETVAGLRQFRPCYSDEE